MSPRYYFRIDEIGVSSTAIEHVDPNGHWVPSTDASDYNRVGGGASGMLWHCNGTGIERVQTGQPPPGVLGYSTFSVFYCGGYGFWVLRGDAINPPDSEVWKPLRFEHDNQNFSSYLTNAGTSQTLRCQRPDQQWPGMLLPDIYQCPPMATHQTYGGLKGDLAIFLALVALSMGQERVQQYIPWMFANSQWRVHGLTNGRLHKRGVVVYVFTAEDRNTHELRSFEGGRFGNYYH